LRSLRFPVAELNAKGAKGSQRAQCHSILSTEWKH
jgi:hypothetical protein